MRKYDRRTLMWLVFFFPYGFLMMWSGDCHFPRFAKSIVSLVVAALVVVIFLPQTQPPARLYGGVEVVGREPAIDLYGPQATEGFEPFLAYLPEYEPPAIVAEPTPTPPPVYVYCNDNGQYYHTVNCRYTKSNTPKVTLNQALNAGFKWCEKCEPPKE